MSRYQQNKRNKRAKFVHEQIINQPDSTVNGPVLPLLQIKEDSDSDDEFSRIQKISNLIKGNLSGLTDDQSPNDQSLQMNPKDNSISDLGSSSYSAFRNASKFFKKFLKD